MSQAPLESFPFSELLHHPAETTERITRARSVRLNRTDADDLVLMSADRADDEGRALELAAGLLASVISSSPEIIHSALPRALPWVRFLPAEDVPTLAAELVAAVEAAATAGNMAGISQLLIEWQHTAEIYQDPDLLRALNPDVTGDFGEVPRP